MVNDEVRNRALTSPAVEALSQGEFDNYSEVIQDLLIEAVDRDTPAAHTLADYAFLGVLWSLGLLDDAERAT